MGGFVRHHGCKLSFIVSGFNRAAIDVDVPAWQCERVDRFVIHALILVLKLVAGRMRRKAVAQVVQIVVHSRIIHHVQLPLASVDTCWPPRRPAGVKTCSSQASAAVRLSAQATGARRRDNAATSATTCCTFAL